MEVKATVKEVHSSMSAGIQQQGAWTRWDQIAECNITLGAYGVQNLSTLSSSVYDVLPSPVYLHLWGKAETGYCSLCTLS